MNVVLYTTNCPKCRILKQKLEESGVDFQTIDDIESMTKRGMTTSPMLGVDDELFGFSQALIWMEERRKSLNA